MSEVRQTYATERICRPTSTKSPSTTSYSTRGRIRCYSIPTIPIRWNARRISPSLKDRFGRYTAFRQRKNIRTPIRTIKYIKTMKTYVLTLSKNFPASHPNAGQATNFGIEFIDREEFYSSNGGNAIKYLWRHGLKHEEGIDDKDKAVEDLEKAIFYINDEIKRIKDTE